MPPQIDDVMRLCCELSTNQQIKAAVKSSGKGAILAGAIAFAGGLLGGPPGIAVGQLRLTTGVQTYTFVVTGCTQDYHAVRWGAAGMLDDERGVPPLPQILMELPPKDKQKLYNEIMVVLGSIDWTDVAQLTALVMGNAMLKQQVTAALISYVTRELKAEVQYTD